jgi:16S rRNA (uracil1498-N3)-methyltransferase
MPRRRFFIPKDQIRGGIATLTPDQAHHLRTVLRLGAGEEVELFDGEGGAYSGRIESQDAKVRIGGLVRLESANPPGTALVLAAALIKPDRFDWILQKGTELGVSRFLPLVTRFTAAQIPTTRVAARMQRWQRIVREACKQSRRLTVPDIQTPMTFDRFLAEQEYSTCSRFMLYEQAPERLKSDAAVGDRVLLCVGPEGGWDAGETEAAALAGFRLVNLGSGILRAETACLAAIAIFQFLLEDRQGAC